MTPEEIQVLKEQAEKNPDIGLIIGASIGAIMPHIALTKLLVEMGLVSKEELATTYAKHLDASKYPKGLAEMLEPIWASLRKDVE